MFLGLQQPEDKELAKKQKPHLVPQYDGLRSQKPVFEVEHLDPGSFPSHGCAALGASGKDPREGQTAREMADKFLGLSGVVEAEQLIYGIKDPIDHIRILHPLSVCTYMHIYIYKYVYLLISIHGDSVAGSWPRASLCRRHRQRGLSVPVPWSHAGVIWGT